MASRQCFKKKLRGSSSWEQPFPWPFEASTPSSLSFAPQQGKHERFYQDRKKHELDMKIICLVERNELKNKPFSNSKSGQHTTIGTVHGPSVSGQSGSLVLSRPQVRDLKNQKTNELNLSKTTTAYKKKCTI